MLRLQKANPDLKSQAPGKRVLFWLSFDEYTSVPTKRTNESFSVLFGLSSDTGELVSTGFILFHYLTKLHRN